MKVYIFRSERDPDLFAVTSSPAAPRLALSSERWTIVRSVALESLERIRISRARADIAADGCYLCRGLDSATRS